MIDIRYRRLSYVAVVTPDLDRSSEFLKRMVGLADGAVSVNPDTRFLRCSDSHHDIMLIRGIEPGLGRISFEMESEADLVNTRTHLDSLGLAPADVPDEERTHLGIGKAFRIIIPDIGVTMEFTLGMNDLDTPFMPTLAKIARLGHIVIATPEPSLVTRFMIEKLNFKMSDGNEWGGLMRPFPKPLPSQPRYR